MREKFENLEFLQVVNFEFLGSLKTIGKKFLLIFGNSDAKICFSKAFVDVAAAGRHRGLGIIHN